MPLYPEEKDPQEPIENMVEEPGEAEEAARTLEQAAASHNTLQGFQAINNERIPEDLEAEGLMPHRQDEKKKK